MVILNFLTVCAFNSCVENFTFYLSTKFSYTLLTVLYSVQSDLCFIHELLITWLQVKHSYWELDLTKQCSWEKHQAIFGQFKNYIISLECLNAQYNTKPCRWIVKRKIYLKLVCLYNCIKIYLADHTLNKTKRVTNQICVLWAIRHTAMVDSY